MSDRYKAILTVAFAGIVALSVYSGRVEKPAVASVYPNKVSGTENVVLPDSQPIQEHNVLSPVLPPVSNSYLLKVPVLMYHHVGELKENATALDLDLTVSPKNFEEQLNYFKQNGYESVSLSQVYLALTEGKTLPAKPVVFTFDDGWKDALQNAIPLLEKYGYTGSFAIATELLGRPDYSTWTDVMSAKNAGMEILSHSENHLDLTSAKYSDEDLRREIFDSKTKLELDLKTNVDFFVYPYGKLNQKAEEMVKQAGYKMAFTTAYGMDLSKDKLLEEPRVRVHGQNSLEKFKQLFEKVTRRDPASPNL